MKIDCPANHNSLAHSCCAELRATRKALMETEAQLAKARELLRKAVCPSNLVAYPPIIPPAECDWCKRVKELEGGK